MFRLQPEREPQPDRGVLRDGAPAPDGARRAERLRGNQPQKETGKSSNLAMQHPGRARQNSLATAGTNFTKPGAQNKGDLCMTSQVAIRNGVSRCHNIKFCSAGQKVGHNAQDFQFTTGQSL